jgi:hypothetical protein
MKYMGKIPIGYWDMLIQALYKRDERYREMKLGARVRKSEISKNRRNEAIDATGFRTTTRKLWFCIRVKRRITRKEFLKFNGYADVDRFSSPLW